MDCNARQSIAAIEGKRWKELQPHLDEITLFILSLSLSTSDYYSLYLTHDINVSVSDCILAAESARCRSSRPGRHLSFVLSLSLRFRFLFLFSDSCLAVDDLISWTDTSQQMT